MLAEITKDGFTLRVFSTMYLDFGLEITATEDGRNYYNPYCLSNDCYGFSKDCSCEDNCDCERRDWTEEEWKECLESEADVLIEAYIGE